MSRSWRILIVLAAIMGADGVILAAASAHGADASRLAAASSMLLFHATAVFGVVAVTERGLVYLLGVVRPDEGSAAADIARTTSGVQRVVKVFEYIN